MTLDAGPGNGNFIQRIFNVNASFELKREWKREHDEKELLLVAPKAEGRTAMNDMERADDEVAFAREGESQGKIEDIESRNTIASLT